MQNVVSFWGLLTPPRSTPDLQELRLFKSVLLECKGITEGYCVISVARVTTLQPQGINSDDLVDP